MEATNHRLHPDIITVMLFTPPDVADIASRAPYAKRLSAARSAEFLPRGIELENYL